MRQKKEINLAWTRDFTLAWAQWWTRDMNPRLVEEFGIGVPNQLSYFNGRLLETYRLVSESKSGNYLIKKGILRKSANHKYRITLSMMKHTHLVTFLPWN